MQLLGTRGFVGRGAFVALTLVALGACERSELVVPDASDVESYYQISWPATVEMNGNVAEIEVTQPGDQLRRGGPLWAKVGPYIYLFNEGTRDLFLDYDGLAAVRVVTLSPAGDQVAQATLPRDALNGITWRRALNISGHARQSGSERPTLLEDLIDWGEEHTDYEYNQDYAAGR